MSKRKPNQLVSDHETDYLFDYFINEDKFNNLLKEEWDENLEKKIENHQPKLDSRILTDKKLKISTQEQELPSISTNSEIKQSYEFNNSEQDDDKDHHSRSPYVQKIEAKYEPPPQPIRQQEIINEKPLLGDNLIANISKLVETPEERRSRARDAYSNLQDLVDKYGVKLSKKFTLNDDPNEMEEEYKMHHERRNKNNQVRFYGRVLLNVICGIEFLNKKYNPFEFKLDDWSKQVASDMDEYTEILEEIYEKYKDSGGKMAPEIKLLFMIIMSGVTFHLSQTLFGPSGLESTIRDNPNVINKILGGLIKGGGNMFGTKNNGEPSEAKESRPNNQNILNNIRNRKSNGATTTTETTVNTNDKSVTSEKTEVNFKKMLEEQRIAYENQSKKQTDMFNARINELQNQLNNKSNPQMVIKQKSPPLNDFVHDFSQNQILSNQTKIPRFQENPLLNQNSGIYSTKPNDSEMFASEINDKPVKKSNKISFEEVLDSLNSTSDSDFDDVVVSSKKQPVSIKKTSVPNSLKKPKNTSVTRSSAKSAIRKKSDTMSDASKKANYNILKI